eukprot:6210840-Pleurochrysis_carterae.AAC.2
MCLPLLSQRGLACPGADQVQPEARDDEAVRHRRGRPAQDDQGAARACFDERCLLVPSSSSSSPALSHALPKAATLVRLPFPSVPLQRCSSAMARFFISEGGAQASSALLARTWNVLGAAD